ncbi:unnamed protein product, partial [Tuber aestivum]
VSEIRAVEAVHPETSSLYWGSNQLKRQLSATLQPQPPTDKHR